MMRKKKFVLLVITLLVTSVIANLSSAYAETGVDPRQTVSETLLEVLETTHDHIQELFDSVQETGIPEEAQEAFDEAVALKDAAQASYDVGNYEDSIEESTEALGKYGDAATLLVETVEEEEEKIEKDDEEKETEAYGLFVGYEKAMDRYEKLGEIAGGLHDSGIDVTEALILLDQVGPALVILEAQLDEGNFNDAEAVLSEVQDMLGRAKGLLQSASNQKKNEKTQKFIDKTTERIQRLQEKLDQFLSAQGVPEEEAQALRDEFNALLSELEALGDDPSDEELDEIIDRLNEIVKESEKIVEEKVKLEEDVGRKLNNIIKQESKFDRFGEKIQKLIDLGVSPDELYDTLEEVQALLDQAFVDLTNDDPEAAEEKIEEADEILDELDKLIDDLEREAEIAKEEEEKDDEDEDKFAEEQAELEEKIKELREKIAELSEEDTTELEGLLDDLQEKLSQATTEGELENIEDELEKLEEQVEDMIDES